MRRRDGRDAGLQRGADVRNRKIVDIRNPETAKPLNIPWHIARLLPRPLNSERPEEPRLPTTHLLNTTAETRDASRRGAITDADLQAGDGIIQFRVPDTIILRTSHGLPSFRSSVGDRETPLTTHGHF